MTRGHCRRYGDYPLEFNIYDPEEIPLSPNVPSPLEPYARREMADYYGMVTSLDECMGRLLEAIDEMGIAGNTVVCFSSDHGDFVGSHGYLTPNDEWLPVTKMLDLGQADTTTDWLEHAPREYAEAIKENHKAFRTGEQEDDPIRGRTLDWEKHRRGDLESHL
jgi:Sulfatase